MSIEDTIIKYYECKQKISEYEKKLEIGREILEEYMKKNNLNSIDSKDFIVKKTNINRETVSKRNLPEDIWKKYCVNINYFQMNIKKK